MTIESKIKSLEKLLEKANEIKKEDSDDPDFKIWKNLVIRTLMKVYGDESFPVKEFKNLRFYYNPVISFLGDDHSRDHIIAFRRDFATAKKFISSLIEELKEEHQELGSVTAEKEVVRTVSKVFISHSSFDRDFVEEIIDILETIGLSSDNIFCSSFDGYGIDLGENFLERLRNELDETILVLFILSENFYKSPICLCEMGATWIKTNEHIPILIPPFDFKDIQGVIPLTQGFRINDPMKLNLFREKIEILFGLKAIDVSSWERKRDRTLGRINDILK
jgi:hypothetical protein